MAKKEATGEPDEPMPICVFSMKMTPDFQAWLAEFAESQRDTIVKVVERSIVEFAKTAGFAKIPPKRTQR